ncbi:MAG: hypothetical protein ACQXXF_07105 [Thermoplasmatota archaeon]
MLIKMKKTVTLFMIFILLFTILTPTYEKAHPQININYEKLIDFIINQKFRAYNKNKPTTFLFNPEDIELKDDAFHGTNSINFAEWWYFDAIFDNNYSAQVNIYVFGVLTQKFVISELNIYKNGINILCRQEYFIFNDLYLSTEKPFIEIDGKQFMKGYIDESGRWTYDVSLDFHDASIDLQFTGKSKGWKGYLSIGGWACVLPKAEVKGKIKLNNIEYYVKGIGYHDHNWDMTVFDLIHFGWYWGKISFDNYTIVWFIILNTRFDGENLCIISKDDGDYINIEPENIYFNAKNFSLDLIWFYPNNFILKVDKKDIYFSITMNAQSIDSNFKINGHYWRYHINYLGNIVINNKLDQISGIQIAEFMRLR